MKQPIYLRLDPEQIAHVKSQPNQSAYINRLVKADQHKETRFEYVQKAITDMLFEQINRQEDEMHIISKLAITLSRAIVGEDVLTEIMRRAGK